MKLHPQNPTPGEDKICHPAPAPASLKELSEIVELILDTFKERRLYSIDAAKKRMEKLKKKL